LAPVTQNINPDPQWVTAVQFKHSYGTLAISSDRSDAHAFIDGKEIGRLPTQTVLPPGNHKVLVSAANAPDKINNVSLAEGQHSDLHMQFASVNGVNSTLSSPTQTAVVSPTPVITPKITPAATVAPSATPAPKPETAKPTPSPVPTVETAPLARLCR
jgi:PEGA domain